MRLQAAAVLLSVLIGSLPPGQAILEAYNTNLKCSCSKVTSTIRVQYILRLQVLPPGNGCPNTEIIVHLRNKLTICLNPEAQRVQKLIAYLQRKNLRSTAPAPVMKRGP
ncbi:PREDICTED: C-X-C motif chemokine 13 [Chinchilla lanigera]|uniref:C-X-C motif chemokine n=1 Tax=Chinchilla lanigera TaxID=34839 RepID=A0A8C2UZG9_CHILA|nr:PREDICTED: C-X-C motif chemokine 13 [Chinchilla lanigera]